ncbi:MAG: FkbM family methyltransferase [Thiotrichales bacterium]|nr:MAG: FkbM family methyltransferase [Thiotrichales bacterium]
MENGYTANHLSKNCWTEDMVYRVNKGKPTKLEKLRWWLLHRGPRREVTIDSLNGLVTFYSKDKAVGKHIYFRREYDVDAVKQRVRLLVDNGYIDEERPGIALNIGANIGLITLALMKFTMFRNVIAFEPVPSNFRLLEKNIAQNGYSEDVQCLQLALSSEDGQVEMELSDENFGDHRIRRSFEKGYFREERREVANVDARRLDSLIGKGFFAKERPGLIWMDIQGHDYDFFVGSKEVISRYRVPVVGEFWPYSINRAGCERDQYCEIIMSLFTHYLDPAGANEFCTVDSFDSLFDRYTGPDEATEITLVNEGWRHKSGF